MREMDCVEVIAEKNEYTAEGVHRGMQGWICHDGCEGGVWLVNFPQCGENGNAKALRIAQTDMYPLSEAPDERVNIIISQWHENTKNDSGESLGEYII